MTAAEPIDTLLEKALQGRAEFEFFDDRHDSAFRLFNGFVEGSPDLVVDVYSRTLVLYNYAEDPRSGQSLVDGAQNYLLDRLPWVQAVVLKTRYAADEAARWGALVYGSAPNRKIRENGVWYAVDLTLNLDSSLYLDTRNLRAWAKANLTGQKVLNTFAYTGSLGAAAVAGGARQVIQMDLNRRFLNLAKDTYALNGWPVQRSDFRAGDFWVQVSQLKRAGELFDCVFVDPPFFSVTGHGTVDLVGESARVINRVRPLIGHQGRLVAINNALFLSGADYLHLLKALCADGYLSIEALIPAPQDFTGFPSTRVGQPPADPAPFNHSTKIAVLLVTRKDGRAAE